MAFIPGFRLVERLYESDNSMVVKATRESDGMPVVLKILKNDFPTIEELARYRREYEVTSAVDAPGVVRGHDLRRHEKTLFMVLEDFGGMSIAGLLKDRSLEIDEFIETGIQIAEALDKVHRANIIHKDISPQNIVINPSTGEVKIIDFGIASRFSREQPSLKSPAVLEGTLSYMSPEQTGRMNRSLDYRTDFYSLGSTFYEMLTGSPPFEADDMMELVHCHIARDPVPVHRRNPTVPLALSKILSKLMAKKAEHRYQSASGLIADLEIVRLGVGLERFEPGLRDRSHRFHMPERLYGRESDVQRLMEAFERTRTGKAELMLLAGQSGIGKSALVHEVHKPITRARGYFIGGKFDQFQRNTPYLGLVAALRELVRQLLTESDASLATWRRDLNLALSPNAQVILDVLPELELVIGPQSAVPELGATEAVNRFNRVIVQLLHVLSADNRVIVIFLDDLQWADTATLNLLRVVLTDESIERLLVIGAYRDNEVDAMHPLGLLLKDLRGGGTSMDSLKLESLGLPDVANLLSDTLHADSAEVTGLARLVLQKTQGNPLFVRQFLMDLYREGLIYRSTDTEIDSAPWAWDLKAIRAAGITDNVVDLLLRRLRKLSPEAQETLRIAACIGNRFDIDTLALIQNLGRQETFERLREAVDEELLRPLSEFTTSEAEDILSPLLVKEFQFQHDRVQQAAYSLIDPDSQRIVQLTIGRSLLATLSPEARSERVFEIVDHMNLGRTLIEDDQEKLELAQLNVTAAHKASGATAYEAALSFVRIAQELLGDNGWCDNYDLTLNAFRQRAMLEYLCGNHDACAQTVSVTLDHVRTDLERAEVYFTRIAQHTHLAEFDAAIDAAYMALSLVGVPLPRENLGQAGQQIIGEVMQLLGGRNPTSLIDEPNITDDKMVLAQRCLRHLTIAAFLSNQELFPLVVGTSVKVSLEYGNAPESALSYANIGLIMGAFMDKFQEGAAFGDLALKLCERFEGQAPSATVCLVVGSELKPWVSHIDEALPIIELGIQEGLDSGEILWVGYLAMYRILLETFSGTRIETVLEGLQERLEFTDETQNLGASAAIRAYKIVLSTLAGRTKSSIDFRSDEIDEATFLQACEEQQLTLASCLYKVLKAQALYLYGRPKEALDLTQDVEGMLHFIPNHPTLADHRLYQSLSLAALYPSGDADRDAAALEQIRANIGRLTVWASSCPDNYLAKRLIVEAELARITEKDLEASDLYDQAIDAAHKHRFIQDEALANELAARFVMENRPKSRIGGMYLRSAHYAYGMWGATRKNEELEMEFPQLLTEFGEVRSVSRPAADFRRNTIQRSRTNSGEAQLDIDTLIKAGQTISGEINLSRLLERLLTNLIENAGAQRGVLLLARNGALMVEAEANVNSERVDVMMSIPLDSPDGTRLVPQRVINYAARTSNMVLIDDAHHDERFLVDPYIQSRETRSVLCQPIINQGVLVGVVYLENDLTSSAFTPGRAHLISLLSGQIAISIQNAELVENLEEKVRERTEQLETHSEFIQQTFGRYMSDQIVDQLLKSPDALDFRGRKATVTAVMSDLRGFMTFSDNLPPETIVKLLNNYLSEMTTVIDKYKGTIDAFVGDGILTIFGVPFQRPDDAERAVACALEMQLAMPRVNEWNRRNGLPDLEMGIGINTGEVVAGNIGSRKRAKYGIVGSNVNLASRVEGYTVGGQVLITESTVNAISAPMTVRDIGSVEPKGVTEPLSLFQVTAMGGAHDLELAEPDLAWVDLADSVPVSFRLVVDKKVTDDVHQGTMIRLSPQGAQIQGTLVPDPFTDVELMLKDDDGDDTGIGIYGKVVDDPAPEKAFSVRFTSVPAEMSRLLKRMMA
ncbi:AAA family ATPase [Tateyamaria pelophila]|uniref:AAA family ATPase n=1 Tax=Tateyamaria pelophila TaxID=328415 RepID=UPI001CBCFB51|nr:AAA family ATPase [Tateyamaria pelophila]